MADTTILGLCSGVGMLEEGIAAGLRYLGRSSRVLGHIERDAYAASILLARMEDKAMEPSPVWAGNLQDVRWEQFAGAVDIVCAGFPCQPHSMAGSRKGTDDDRWIWPAIADCIRRVQPGNVFLENVSGLRSSGGFAPVLTDLAALGFRVEWDSVRASDVGASHQRERVFILAHRGDIRNERGRKSRNGSARPADDDINLDDPNGSERRPGSLGGSGCSQGPNGKREAHGGAGVSGTTCVGLADASSPRPQERGVLGQHHGPQQPAAERDCSQMADDIGTGWGAGQYSDRQHDRAVPHANGEFGIFAPGPASPEWPGIIADYPHLAPALESGVCRVVDGVANRMDGVNHGAEKITSSGNIKISRPETSTAQRISAWRKMLELRIGVLFGETPQGLFEAGRRGDSVSPMPQESRRDGRNVGAGQVAGSDVRYLREQFCPEEEQALKDLFLFGMSGKDGEDQCAKAMEQRTDRLRCVGNGVIPAQAGCAFVHLLRRAGLVL